MAMIPARNRKRMQEGGEAETTATEPITKNPFVGTIPEQKTTLSTAETVTPTPLTLQSDQLMPVDAGQNAYYNNCPYNNSIFCKFSFFYSCYPIC